MLLETDFNSNREEKVVLEIDREQQEKLPIDMSSFPFMFKKNVLDEKLGNTVPWHWHNVFELNYVLEGELLWKTHDSANIVRKGELQKAETTAFITPSFLTCICSPACTTVFLKKNIFCLSCAMKI